MLMRIECKDREEWLAQRYRGIGGSEAAAAIGLSPWMNPIQLWKLKTRRAMPQDLSDNTAVQQGVAYEPILREFYKATHPQYEIWYHATDILYQEERPFIFATLDGEIMDETGRFGLLEIKTATPNGKAGWEQWSNGNMPQHYYVQVLHQLIATGYEFVSLFACLFSLNGDMTLKSYEIERNEVKEDMAWLLAKEQEFWGYVERDIMPPMPLIL